MSGHVDDHAAAGREVAKRIGSAEEWIHFHSSRIPPRLADRMLAALHEVGATATGADAGAAAGAGVGLLRTVLERGEGTRADALDLLAADALVTMACEISAGSDELLDQISGEIISSVLASLEAYPRSEGAH